MKISSVAIFICIMVLGVMISGCIKDQPVASSTNQTSYQKHTVVCPNPECPLHDPNYRFTDSYESSDRPIDMEIGSTGSKYYLCQVCGEEWWA